MNKRHQEKNKQLYRQGIYQHAEFQRAIFFFTNFIITAILTLFMADLLWRIGFDGLKITLLIFFLILSWQISLGFTHSIYGLFSKPKQNKFNHVTQTVDFKNKDIKLANTAILMPCYNEGTRRVYEGIRSMYLSLKETGQLDYFDIFILSDSTDPNKWITEETLWFKLCQQLNAFDRIYYRKRENNFHKKAGNIAEFCKSWGKRYRYMICMDADSIMSGEAIVSLVKIMEANPGIGICQSAPKIIRGTTAFARMQQFASNFYGAIFQSGLNFWQQGKGNYWGHNAIIRIAPFMEHCSLPRLPGREPFGGKILSHDFVEAAFMQKAGWAVWMAYDIEGSYEETPPNLIDYAVRDRRWCQGNLQHTWLLLSKGMPTTNKIHLLNGIMAYVGSLFWLIFLILSTIIVYQIHAADLSIVTVSSFAKFINLSLPQESFLIFCFVMSIIFLPKILSIINILVYTPQNIKLFGGIKKLISSMLIEIVLSTVIAPVLMLFHSKFVLCILVGKGTRWNPQNRDSDDGIPTSTAIKVHAVHTIIGFVWALIAYQLNTTFFFWLLPITLSMMISIPISLMLSKRKIGDKFKAAGIFLTPPETAPTKQLLEFEKAYSKETLVFNSSDIEQKYYGITQAIVDPYVNAVHIMILNERKNEITSKSCSIELEQKLLSNGPSSLNKEEVNTVLYDASCLHRLHCKVWQLPSDSINKYWEKVISDIRH